MKSGLAETLERIASIIEERKRSDPAKSYVARLLAEGEDAVLKKIGRKREADDYKEKAAAIIQSDPSRHKVSVSDLLERR